MNILLFGDSPSTPSRSTRLLHHVGERLALLGHRYVKLHVRDLPAQALVHADFNDAELKVAGEQVAHLHRTLRKKCDASRVCLVSMIIQFLTSSNLRKYAIKSAICFSLLTP